ncbi:universal stress protein [Ekhidna sp.]|uniref:universal stress protein n=1 Tax=Ekhidna sp. TaxID=2608089 RepID=UPI003B505144
MKNILVPSDFSNLSEYALEFAVSLAEKLDARVTLLHCEEIPLGDTSLHLSGEAGGGSVSEDSLYNAQLFRANRQKLKKLEQDYSSDKVLVNGQQFGNGFLKGIMTYIEKHPTDLVVIGTTGQESIQEFFSGNHTEQLIDNLDIPIISLQDQQFHPIEDIVLGLDMEDEIYTQKALHKVKVICDGLGSTLHIVDITKSKDDEDAMQLLNKVAKIAGLSNYMVDVIEDNHPNKSLLEYAEGVDAGLIIVLSSAKGGLSRFLNHSFATRLTKKSSIPVLTIKKD